MTDPHGQEPEASEGSMGRMPSNVCLTLLAGATVGRVAFTDGGGRLELLPVNFVVVDREIYFRTSPNGPLSQLVKGHVNVAFEVDHVDPASGQGWNVTVRGESARVDDPETIELATASGLGTPWAGGDRREVVKIVIHEIDGRRVSQT